MKKIIKSIPVYLTVVMLLCSMLVVPAFATSDEPQIVLWDKCTEELLTTEEDFVKAPSGHYWAIYCLQPGTYKISFGMLSDSSFVSSYVGGTFYEVGWVQVLEDGTRILQKVDMASGDTFVVTEDMLDVDVCEVWLNSYLVEPVITVYSEPVIDNPDVELPPEGDNAGVQGGLYYQAFDMFADFFYGDGAELTGEQNMVLTILATTAVLFVVVVPFLILFFVLRLFR